MKSLLALIVPALAILGALVALESSAGLALLVLAVAASVWWRAVWH
jgi:hypothetical protein